MPLQPLNTIYEGFEHNKNGNPINSNGKIIQRNKNGKIVYNNNGKPVLQENTENPLPRRIKNPDLQENTENPLPRRIKNLVLQENPLPKRIINPVLKHPKTGYYYIKRNIQNNSGSTTEKFLKVNKNKKMPIQNGNEFIYLNKNSGEPINKNGRKYFVNNLTNELVKTKNGYIKKEESNSNLLLGKKKPQPTQSPQPPPGMMRLEKEHGPGGFKKNRPTPTYKFVTRTSTNSTRSFLNSGPARKSNQVPTVFGPGFR
jgi:hypothetical protein